MSEGGEMIWAYPLCSCETNEEDRVQVSQYFEKETDMENIKLQKTLVFCENKGELPRMQYII